MSTAQTIRLHPALNTTTASSPTVSAGLWKKFVAAFWAYTESTCVYYTEQAKRQGHYHYY
jgi:hypothetical protein